MLRERDEQEKEAEAERRTGRRAKRRTKKRAEAGPAKRFRAFGQGLSAAGGVDVLSRPVIGSVHGAV